MYTCIAKCQRLLNLRLVVFPQRQILESSKLKEFADNNFKVDENGRKFSKWIET